MHYDATTHAQMRQRAQAMHEAIIYFELTMRLGHKLGYVINMLSH